jgi:hypothetical protein
MYASVKYMLGSRSQFEKNCAKVLINTGVPGGS